MPLRRPPRRSPRHLGPGIQYDCDSIQDGWRPHSKRDLTASPEVSQGCYHMRQIFMWRSVPVHLAFIRGWLDVVFGGLVPSGLRSSPVMRGGQMRRFLVGTAMLGLALTACSGTATSGTTSFTPIAPATGGTTSPTPAVSRPVPAATTPAPVATTPAVIHPSPAPPSTPPPVATTPVPAVTFTGPCPACGLSL
jgi:hypothetical protein